MVLGWRVHKLGEFIHNKGNIWSSHPEMLKVTNHLTVHGGIDRSNTILPIMPSSNGRAFTISKRHREGVPNSNTNKDSLLLLCENDSTSKVYPISDKKSNQWLSILCRTGIISILVTIVISNV